MMVVPKSQRIYYRTVPVSQFHSTRYTASTLQNGEKAIIEPRHKKVKFAVINKWKEFQVGFRRFWIAFALIAPGRQYFLFQ
jgi:hypothetical protein